MSETADVVVAGGGLAGAAAAIRLARAGLRVVLLEREAGPKTKVCGEFLSAVALGELAALGVAAEPLGAVPLAEARVSARGRTAFARLPFSAASLTRERLDEALLSAAAHAGADVRRGVPVRAVETHGAAGLVRCGAGAVAARHVLLACGKADLPARRRGRGLHGTLVGLKRHAVLGRAGADGVAGGVELTLFPGGYCGIQPVEGGRANVCLVIEKRVLKDCGPDGAFEAVRRGASRAGDILADARWTDARAAAVGFVPYGFVRASTDGPYHLGDQAAVIPSFCGEGMALALVSARLASEAILAGEPAAPYQRRFARLAATRVRAAALLSRALCAGPVQPAAAATACAAPALVRQLAARTRLPRTPDAAPLAHASR